MAYDQQLAERIRQTFPARKGVSEKRMFGGLCFLVGGHMAAGIVQDQLVVRVGPDAYEDALAEPHVRPMDFTGKPMKGIVYVTKEGLMNDTDLKSWLRRGVSFARSLPPK